jgi:hypothetical protein
MSSVGLNPSASNSVSAPPAVEGASQLPPLPPSAVAGRVADLLSQGREQEATDLLNEARRGQPPAMQDALDRMVAARLSVMTATNPAARPLSGLSPAAGASPLFSFPFGQPTALETIARVKAAGVNLPTTPELAYVNERGEVTQLTKDQKFDAYASIVETRGNADAIADLRNGKRVILGLRVQDSSMENRGQGAYNDRVVVLWRGKDGVAHVEEFLQATTEPTARYDGNQRNNPALAKFSKADGIDRTKDGIPELGRLRDGTTQMREREDKYLGHFALRPTPAAVKAGQDRAQRDLNHNTIFDRGEGIENLNPSFLIHIGGRTITGSAGCTTIHPKDYAGFVTAVTGDARQTQWQYVLTTTAGFR